MAALTANQRQKVAEWLMDQKNPPGGRDRGVLKNQVVDVVAAIDDWTELPANRSSLNSDIDTAAPGNTMDADQIMFGLAAVLMAKIGRIEVGA